MQQQKLMALNGVDVERLQQTMEAIKGQPELAKFQFRARNRWIDGGHCQAMIKDFYGAGQEDTSRQEGWTFDEDEPPVLLGKNRGANPVEYALVALSGCLTTTLVIYAAAKGIKLEGVESYLEGDLDVRGLMGLSDEVRKGYEGIRVTFKIQASEATEAQLQELIEMAQAHSPVFDIVTHETPVQVGLAS